MPAPGEPGSSSGGRTTYGIRETCQVGPSLEKDTRPPRLVLCRVSAHKRVRRLKESPMRHISQNIMSRGHGCSLRGGISEKDSTLGLQWAYFQGFAPPEPLAEYVLATRKRFAKPLKISSRTLNAIDAALKRTPVDIRHTCIRS
jgi:hypothetical protein